MASFASRSAFNTARAASRAATRSAAAVSRSAARTFTQVARTAKVAPRTVQVSFFPFIGRLKKDTASLDSCLPHY